MEKTQCLRQLHKICGFAPLCPGKPLKFLINIKLSACVFWNHERIAIRKIDYQTSILIELYTQQEAEMEGQEAAIIHYRDDETMYVEAKA